MPHIFIKTIDNVTLFEGAYPNAAKAIQTAIERGISLKGADLRGLNLDNGNFDGGIFSHAQFDNSTCYGANFSQCLLDGASIKHSNLSNACLCEASLLSTNFQDSYFNNTLISDARIDNCAFSCPSAFNLNFADAHTGLNNYISTTGTPLPFTGAPLVLLGLPQRLVMLDTHIMIGSNIYARPHAKDEINTLYDGLIASFG